MCDPVTIAVAAGTALVGKKMADDTAKKKEDAFKKQHYPPLDAMPSPYIFL